MKLVDSLNSIPVELGPFTARNELKLPMKRNKHFPSKEAAEHSSIDTM